MYKEFFKVECSIRENALNEIKDFEIIYADADDAYSYWNNVKQNPRCLRVTVMRYANAFSEAEYAEGKSTVTMESQECMAEFDISGHYYYDIPYEHHSYI